MSTRDKVRKARTRVAGWEAKLATAKRGTIAKIRARLREAKASLREAERALAKATKAEADRLAREQRRIELARERLREKNRRVREAQEAWLERQRELELDRLAQEQIGREEREAREKAIREAEEKAQAEAKRIADEIENQIQEEGQSAFGSLDISSEGQPTEEDYPSRADIADFLEIQGWDVHRYLDPFVWDATWTHKEEAAFTRDDTGFLTDPIIWPFLPIGAWIPRPGVWYRAEITFGWTSDYSPLDEGLGNGADTSLERSEAVNVDLPAEIQGASWVSVKNGTAWHMRPADLANTVKKVIANIHDKYSKGKLWQEPWFIQAKFIAVSRDSKPTSRGL